MVTRMPTRNTYTLPPGAQCHHHKLYVHDASSMHGHAHAANTNAWVLKENSPGIPAENITCLTRLDHNRAIAQVGV